MPDQLTPLMTPPPPPRLATEAGAGGARLTRAAIVQAIAIVVGIVVLGGVLGGFLVERLWTAPQGMVVQHHWYRGITSLHPLTQAQNADQGVFAGLAWYAAASCVLGVVLGALAAALLARSELVTLAAVAIGGLAAGVVMRLVAVALAPPDPTGPARSAADGTILPDTLHLGPWWTIILLPGAALLGLAAVFLLVTPHKRPIVTSSSSSPTLRPDNFDKSR